MNNHMSAIHFQYEEKETYIKYYKIGADLKICTTNNRTTRE